MQLLELKKQAENLSIQFPELESEIRDFYFLAEYEIESGESEVNECELAISDINELIVCFVNQNLLYEKENS